MHYLIFLNYLTFDSMILIIVSFNHPVCFRINKCSTAFSKFLGAIICRYGPNHSKFSLL